MLDGDKSTKKNKTKSSIVWREERYNFCRVAKKNFNEKVTQVNT